MIIFADPIGIATVGISVLKCFPIPPKGSWKYSNKLPCLMPKGEEGAPILQAIPFNIKYLWFSRKSGMTLIKLFYEYNLV